MNESAPGNRPISRTHFSSAHEASRADEKSVREILRGRVVSIEFGARPISCGPMNWQSKGKWARGNDRS